MKIKINNTEDLKQLKGKESFDDIDIEFAVFLQRISNDNSPLLALTGALVSYTLRNNHICMRLEEYAGKKFPLEIKNQSSENTKYFLLPELSDWLKELKKFSKVITFTNEVKPLVVDIKHRLYIQKYYKYESDLAEFLINKINANKNSILKEKDIKIKTLSKYFQNNEEIDYQQFALSTTLKNQFTVITGSPGTGKTSVVATILAAHYQKDIGLKVGVCAPTGKAAARLKESIIEEIKNLNIDKIIKEKIKNTATSTIHRLLKVKYNTPHFSYNKEMKLNIDLLILDEASMVSQPLMCKLFYALSDSVKVVLLGDKDQLASVEEGSVFGDICDCKSLPINSFLNNSDFNTISTIIELKKSHRFDDTKGIGLIKNAINNGNFEKVMEISKIENNEIKLQNLPNRIFFKNQIIEYLNNIKIIINGKMCNFQDYLKMNNIEEKFQFINKFRILSAKRNGIYGINNINSIIIEHYFDKSQRYSNGISIMITQNDHRQQLYNGDVGIVQKENEITKIYFPDTKNSRKYRSFSPNHLPQHEYVFAMTIHKSQGSGFQKILLILPEKDSPLLTRELLYTGVTRAEKYCEIWGNEEILKQTIQRKIKRDSGLMDRLSAL